MIFIVLVGIWDLYLPLHGPPLSPTNPVLQMHPVFRFPVPFVYACAGHGEHNVGPALYVLIGQAKRVTIISHKVNKS